MHCCQSVVGIFSLARRADKSERQLHHYMVENAQLKKQHADMQEKVANAEKDAMEQRRLADEAYKERMDAFASHAKQNAHCEELKIAVEKLEYEQSCWEKKQSFVEAEKELAVKKAEEAERAASGAISEVERLRGEIADLKATQQFNIQNAIQQYAEGEEAAFASGVEVADFLTSFVDYTSADIPMIAQKLEDFKASHDMDPAWFIAALDRAKQQQS